MSARGRSGQVAVDGVDPERAVLRRGRACHDFSDPLANSAFAEASVLASFGTRLRPNEHGKKLDRRAGEHDGGMPRQPPSREFRHDYAGSVGFLGALVEKQPG